MKSLDPSSPQRRARRIVPAAVLGLVLAPLAPIGSATAASDDGCYAPVSYSAVAAEATTTTTA